MASNKVPNRKKVKDPSRVLQKLSTRLNSNQDMLLFNVDLALHVDGSIISKGNFYVKSATNYNEEKVAAKVLRDDYRFVKRFVSECEFVLDTLKKNVHPNIVGIYGFVNSLKECPHLIMECMDRPLTQFIRDNEYHKTRKMSCDPRLKLHIARGIANALRSEFFHSHNPPFIHCGLTCGNILLTEYYNRPKISNFSRVRIENNALPEPCNELRSYLPPEVLGGGSKVSRGCVDMYAFGKVLYYLATDTVPSLNEPEIGYDEKRFTKASTKDDSHHCLRTVAVKGIFAKTSPESRMSADDAYKILKEEIGPVVQPRFRPIYGSGDDSQYTRSASGRRRFSVGSDSSRFSTIPPHLQHKVLTDNELVDIAFNFVKNWKSLAAALNLTEVDESDIKEGHEPMDRKRAMLRTWKQRNGPNATVNNLLKGYYRMNDYAGAQNLLSWLDSELSGIGTLPEDVSDSNESAHESPAKLTEEGPVNTNINPCVTEERPSSNSTSLLTDSTITPGSASTSATSLDPDPLPESDVMTVSGFFIGLMRQFSDAMKISTPYRKRNQWDNCGYESSDEG